MTSSNRKTLRAALVAAAALAGWAPAAAQAEIRLGWVLSVTRPPASSRWRRALAARTVANCL